MTSSVQTLSEQFLETSANIKRILNCCSNLTLEEKLASLLQIHALEFVNRQDITVGQLSHELSLSSASVAQLIDRLVKAKRIVRQPDIHDKRITHLVITPKGKADLNEMKTQFLDKISQVLEHLPEADVQELIRLHQKLNQMLSQIH